MGWSFSWIAVEPSAEKALIERFGLNETDETSEMADFPLSVMRLPGWYVLHWDHEDVLVDQDLLRELSAHGRVVAVFLEEHVMVSSAEEWHKGERVWGAVHNSELDLLHIGTEGRLPEAYADIHRRVFSEQEESGGAKADVDHIIEIPLALAKHVVGYQHDMDGGSFRSAEAAHSISGGAKQRPIDGATATNSRFDKKASRWYQEHKARGSAKPGFLGRLFGKS